jgi:universal stress protein F
MITKILVALDGSPRASLVFDTAVDLATRYGAALIPFRAIAIPPEFPPAAHVDGVDALPAYLRKQALAAFTELSARAPAMKLEPPVLSEKEPAWRAIVDAAKEHNVDLIVLGSHGYLGFDHVLGTTAGKVANLAKRSVYVVHDRDAK